MKNIYLKKVFRYGVFFILSLYIILFVGKSFNQDTRRTETNWFSLTGYKDFKLGMDIAGGVKLTYKLNFGDYKQIYTNKTEFNKIKSDVINVISKKIDERISKLGVSDYKVYNRTYDEKDYLIVEIGGVSNIDEAKNIIGKTITLHFKVPLEGNDKGIIKKRQEAVADLYKKIKNSKEDIQTIVNNFDLVDTYYNRYDKVTKLELPMVYNNINLDSVKIGTLFPLQSGLYHITKTEKGDNEIKGWTIIKLVDREVKKSSNIDSDSVLRVINEKKLDYNRDYDFDNYNLKKGEIKFNNGTLIYNNGEIFTGENAYKLTLYQISKPNFVGKEGKELVDLQEKYNKKINNIIEKIKNGDKLDDSVIEIVNNQRVSESNLSKYIPGFTAKDGINKIDSIDAIYISNIFKKKNKEQKLYLITKINNIRSSEVENLKTEMKTKIFYTIDEVFIKDMPTWQTAVDITTNQILDAKFFQYASVGTSPTGQPVVQLHFNSKGEEVFCHISEENIGNPLAIFIGDKKEPVTVATIRTKICGSSPYIEGNFTQQEAKDMVKELNEGAFPVKMNLESQEKIAPILGTKALFGSLYAGILGIFLIGLFLFFLYGWEKALVGFLVLVVYAIYLLAILKSPIVDYAFSLSGIAAIILALGMAVDANILIFERVREEIKSGKKKNSAIDVAVKRSWSPILDGNLSTGLVAIVLAGVGMSIFRGFGTMILVTMSLVLFINVKLTKTLLHLIFGKE